MKYVRTQTLYNVINDNDKQESQLMLTNLRDAFRGHSRSLEPTRIIPPLMTSY